MKAYDYDVFMELSTKWDVSFDGTAITIDNFYNNAQEIHDHLVKRNYPLWKFDKDHDSVNSINYNDCRIVDRLEFTTDTYYKNFKKILDLCRKHWWQHDYTWNPHFEINCFQTINVFDTTLQHFPHIDSPLNTPDNLSTLNMLVYLDKQEDGGTAIYEGDWITNNEQTNLLYPVEQNFKITKMLKHKFNRCVIFPGNRLHGAFIENYKNYTKDKWRFTQVIFLHPNTNH